MKPLLITLLSIGALLTSSCARQISSNVYSADHVGEAAETYPGIIISIREVTVEGSEELGDNTLGIVGGGIAGALLGSTVGKGGGNTLATVAGGVLGATGGAYAEKALKSQQALEYIVSLENGQTRTVVQGMEPRLCVGQSVFVMVGHKGRSRVIAK